MKKKSVAILILLALTLSLFTFAIPTVAVETYEWWDLRGYEESIFNSAVANTGSEFAGWRTISGTYDGVPMDVTHYWGWYAETPNNINQRIDIYVPSNATTQSAILHMVNNSGWMANGYHGGVRFNSITGALTQMGGNGNQMLEALARGIVVVSSGARSGGAAEETKSPATMADTKAAIRFVRANMAPGMALDGIANPNLVFVTGTSGGGALSNIVGASGNSPDYFAIQYDIGALGLEWTGTTPYADASLLQRVNGRNWTNTISDAYAGVLSYCPMDFFGMGEQESEWFYNEKRWTQPNEAIKTPAIMTLSNALAAYVPEYVNALGLRDENGALLTASYVCDNAEEGGLAGGTLMDATVRLMEAAIERAIDNWAAGIQVETGTSSLAPLYDNEAIRNNILINGAAVTGPVDASTYPAGSTVEITNRTQFLLGLNATALPNIFAFSYSNNTVFSNFLGNLFSDGSFFNGLAWDVYTGSLPGVGRTQTGTEWEDYLKTPGGQRRVFQIKTASAIPYLNANNLEAFPYLNDAGFYGSSEADVAPYWRPRYGMNDQQMSYGGQAVFYYSLINNPAVNVEMSDLQLFNWNRGHEGNYDNIEPFFAWIEACVADYYANLTTTATPSARVEQLNGNQNRLFITIVVQYSDGTSNTIEWNGLINNNAAGSYQVGSYRVYVDTKGNTQIRACYIVD